MDSTGFYYVWIRDYYADATLEVGNDFWGLLSVTVKQGSNADKRYTVGAYGTKIYNDKMYIWVQPNTGSATPHKKSRGINRYNPSSQNCYTYATGLRENEPLDPGDISGVNVDFRDVTSVANAVVADLKKEGYDGRILGVGQDGIKADVTSEEFRIAVCVGTKPAMGKHRGTVLLCKQ